MPKRQPSPPALLLVNIGQLITLRSISNGPRRGREMSELALLHDAAVLCSGGKIVSVGKTSEAVKDRWVQKHRGVVREIDCAGKVALPGFVDSHTHPAFAAPRLVDFEKRIAGATYVEIAAAGGGIWSSVEAVRDAGRRELSRQVTRGLDEMAQQGTTTVEAKSGYGLSTNSEIKSLEAIRDAAKSWPGTVVPTLLGAHLVPPEFRQAPDAYVRVVCEEMIPEASDKNLAWFVDVFCDRGAFTPEQAEQIFLAARQRQLGVRAHLCQLSRQDIVPLLQYDPASLDHMDCVNAEDIEILANRAEISPNGGPVITLLPASNYFLGLDQYPPARTLVDNGIPMALATDYNPGTSPTASMPFVLSLACTQMRLSPAEAIVAATVNGAWALRLADRKGTIEPGKDADLAVFDVADFREIPYWIAATRCAETVLNGVVLQREYEPRAAGA